MSSFLLFVFLQGYWMVWWQHHSIASDSSHVRNTLITPGRLSSSTTLIDYTISLRGTMNLDSLLLGPKNGTCTLDSLLPFIQTSETSQEGWARRSIKRAWIWKDPLSKVNTVDILHHGERCTHNSKFWIKFRSLQCIADRCKISRNSRKAQDTTLETPLKKTLWTSAL